MPRQATMLIDLLGSTGQVCVTFPCSIDSTILDVFSEGLGSTELGVVLATAMVECLDGMLSAPASE